MASVDPDDDEIRRFVVQRYGYDPDRHERRHQVIAAVDNKREWNRLLSEASAALKQRRAAGENIAPSEHISGVVLEPGHRRRARNGRLLWRALEHGAGSDPRLADLELPSNMASYSALRPGFFRRRGVFRRLGVFRRRLTD